MQRWPNLFLIGAQKGGSTFLASLLVSAPEIAYFAGKEANIFNRDTPEACREALKKAAVGEQPPARYLLDASVNYTRHPYFPETVANMKAVLGEVQPRFIYVLRDPVERMISHYFFNRERWGEAISFAEAIEADDRYIWPGRYDVQIKRFLEFYPPESFHFLTFDGLAADPARELTRICDWLALETPDPASLDSGVRNATDKRQTRRPILPVLNRMVRGTPALRRLARALPPAMQTRLNRLMSVAAPREEIDATTRRALYHRLFADSVVQTEALTGLDLSAWKARYEANGT